MEQVAKRVDIQSQPKPGLKGDGEEKREVDNGQNEGKDEVGEDQSVDGMPDLNALVHSGNADAEKSGVQQIQSEGNRCKVIQLI